jgi:uncharacterized DUF497 family protein
MHPRDAEGLHFDDDNEAHLAGHRLSIAEVSQVWLNSPLYVPNKKGLTAAWLMLGDTHGGRAVTVAVLVLEIPRLLRPITGWDSTAAELTRWREKS